MTEDVLRKEFLRGSLRDNGLLQKPKMSMFMVNGKIDRVTPIGNLYLALESAPPAPR